MKTIISSHSNLAYGLKDTLIFMGTDITNAEFIVLDEKGVNDFEEKVRKTLDSVKNEEILIFVDIFGGTPYNTFAKEILSRKLNAEMISGFNVSMIIQALSADSITEMLDDFAEDNGIKIYSKELLKLYNSDDE